MPRGLASRSRIPPIAALVTLAIVSELMYVLVVAADQSLHVEAVGKQSLLTILVLFGIAFICYLLAIKTALAARQEGRLLCLIVSAAIVFRVTVLFSDPIEEIDLYRYLWDGQATLAGVSPFRYSPRQILQVEDVKDLPTDLARLADQRDRLASNAELLDRIHFGELPTIYPPVSQSVFALAALCTPPTASLVARMTIMRAWFVAFDLGTLFLVIQLLRWSGKPLGWSIAYAWCPLLVKEVANSGHLDVLAVFFSTLALYLTIRALFPAKQRRDQVEPGPFAAPATLLLAGVSLALAVGAKLYPIIFVPLFLVASWRHLGWRVAAAALGLCTAVSAVVVWPMVPHDTLAELPAVHIAATDEDAPPLPPPDLGVSPRDPSQSLRAFLGEWEMNDFLFLLVMENVRPTDRLPANEVAWFSVTPQNWRYGVCQRVADIVGIEVGRSPFFISRAVTSGIFLGLVVWFVAQGSATTSAAGFLEAAFLTVAWFWLLLPTQNPWYWTWALPLLPFARGRPWLALSGLALLYYFRFWLAYHFEKQPVLGTAYRGPQFFDYIVTWVEFGPWLTWLAFDAFLRRKLGDRHSDRICCK